MPTLKVAHSGVTAANPCVNPSGGGPRGEVQGWSIDAARRCDAFLKSVRFVDLEERGLHGYALTLTVRYRPASHAVWNSMVTALRKRLQRRGMVCGHFVTEWQQRGRTSKGPCPHLHLVAFFADPEKVTWFEPGCEPFSGGTGIGVDALKLHWLEIADEYDPRLHGQHVELVHDVRGWFRYLAKHAARGVWHYQRTTEALPQGWVKTGRMWGSWGDWPLSVWDGKISHAVFFALRRFSISYQRSTALSDLARSRVRLLDARNPQQTNEARRFIAISLRRLRFLSRALKRNERKIAVIVPINEWMPADLIQRWLDAVAYQSEIMHQMTGEVQPFYALSGEPIDPPRGWVHRETP